MTSELKRLNKIKKTRLIVMLSIFFVVLVTGITVAWLSFETGEDVDIKVGKVELNTVVNASENLATIIPGELIVESSSFSRASDGEKCYVRAVLDYHSKANALTRQEQNYLLALNAYDYSSNISTGVEGYKWLDLHDGYYYLVDDNNELVVLDNTSTYNFASDVIFPSLHEEKAEGLDLSKGVPQLYLDVKFQAIQSEYLPSSDVDYIIEMFNIAFDTKVKSEYLVRFNTGNDLIINAQVVKAGKKASEPFIEDDSMSVTWYIDSACVTPFDFNSEINSSCMLYAKWEEDIPIIEETPTEEGLIFMDGAVIGYVGDEQKVIIPESYTLGERKLITKHVDHTEGVSELLKLTLLAEFGYDFFPFTVGVDDVEGFEVVCNNTTELNDSQAMMMLLLLPGPFTISYYIDDYTVVDGENEVTTIASHAFINAPKLLNAEESMYVMNELNDVREVVIPDTVTTIEDGAFALTRLNKLIIPESVETMGQGALFASNIGHLVMPSSITSTDDIFIATEFIGYGLELPYSVLELYNESDFEIDATMRLTNLTESEIYTYQEEGVTLYFKEFDDLMFLIGSSVDNEVLTLPASGTTLRHLYNNTRIRLNEYVIGEAAFEGNNNLKQVNINDNVLGFDTLAFNGCGKLELLFINNNIFETHEDAVNDCDYIHVLTNNTFVGDQFASNITIGDSVYMLQNSGYESVEFTDDDTLPYAMGKDSDEFKWLRFEVDGDYNYYKVYNVTQTIENVYEGFKFDGETLVGYTGDETEVTIPSTYSLVKVNVEVPVMDFDTDLEYDSWKLITSNAVMEFTDVFMYSYCLSICQELYSIQEILSWKVAYNNVIAVEGSDYTCTSIVGAFTENHNVRSVTLPDTVTEIGEEAFQYCSNLQTIVIPDGVTSIGYAAFSGCQYLTIPSLPSGITNIGENAFNNCSRLALTSLPSGLTVINQWSFSGCNSLVLESLPSGVTSIGYHAFWNCTNLALTELPAGLTYIGDYAFSLCSKLALTSIPSGITIIENYVFQGCTSLVSPSLPNGLKTIDMYAFQGCTKLALTSLPSSVTYIASYAFQNCKSLALTSLPSGVTSIGNYAFNNCTNLVLTSIPSGVKIIEDNAFQDCTSLSSISLPSGVTTIDYCAFDGCTNLSSISLPTTLTSIGKYAFQDCSNLAITSLPNSITSIGEYAFKNCSKLALTSLPSGLTSIGRETFYHCYKLELTSLPSGVTTIDYGAFWYCTSLALTSLPDGLTSLGDLVFTNCSGIKLTSLPDSLTSIGYAAFSGCTKITLTSLNKLTNIGDSAFSRCSGLTQLSISTTVTTIGNNPFNECNNLTLTVDENHPTFDIVDKCLINKTNKTLIASFGATTIPEGMETIGGYAFSGDNNLTSIVIPNSVTSIGKYAFYNCVNLVSISLPSGVTRVEDFSFCDCPKLVFIYLPGNITYIGNYVFDSDDKLSYILCETDAVANLVSAKGIANNYIYSLQASGYASGTTEETVIINDSLTIYVATVDNYKWVRNGNKYYKCKAAVA